MDFMLRISHSPAVKGCVGRWICFSAHYMVLGRIQILLAVPDSLLAGCHCKLLASLASPAWQRVSSKLERENLLERWKVTVSECNQRNAILLRLLFSVGYKHVTGHAYAQR